MEGITQKQMKIFLLFMFALLIGMIGWFGWYCWQLIEAFEGSENFRSFIVLTLFVFIMLVRSVGEGAWTLFEVFSDNEDIVPYSHVSEQQNRTPAFLSVKANDNGLSIIKVCSTGKIKAIKGGKNKLNIIFRELENEPDISRTIYATLIFIYAEQLPSGTQVPLKLITETGEIDVQVFTKPNIGTVVDYLREPILCIKKTVKGIESYVVRHVSCSADLNLKTLDSELYRFIDNHAKGADLVTELKLAQSELYERETRRKLKKTD